MSALLTCSDVIQCPRGKHHHARMESVLMDGVRFGKLVAWCHTCGRELDNGPAVVTLTDEERARQHQKPRKLGKKPELFRERNDTIRRLFQDGARQCDLAKQFGITDTRISHIINGRRKSA